MSRLDMFTSLNNDILQCILYEWLSVKDICQLDIAVCNHSLRQLYYEALQLSTLSIFKNKKITEMTLYELIKWSKKRGIKNPIEAIDLYDFNTLLSHETYYELSNYFKYLKYTQQLEISYWNFLIFPAFLSLQNLKELSLNNIDIPSNICPWMGLLFRQLSSLEAITLSQVSFDPILLMYISELPLLKTFGLEEYCLVHQNTSDFTRYLSTFIQLETFSLSLKRINSSALDFSYLSSFSRLTQLYLLNVKFAIKDILQLTYLEDLIIGSFEKNAEDFANNVNYDNYLPLHQLKDTIIHFDNIDPNFLQYIFQSKQLTSLTIHDNFMKSSSLYDIHQLSSLTCLYISHVNLDEPLFDSLCKLSQLNSLEITGINLSPYHPIIFFPYSKLSKQLTTLNIKYCPKIDGKGILEISQLTSLTNLTFNWFSSSIEELQPLSNLKQLKKLSIYNKSTIIPIVNTTEGLNKFNEMFQIPES